MYEILDDGRVALDPTSPNDKIALSVYSDLLRKDETENYESEVDAILRENSQPDVYHIHTNDEMPIRSLASFLERNDFELVKLVVRKLTPANTVVNSEGEKL